MRGRTNIPPRTKPTINGDIREFEIAPGNTISVGDFVSYKFRSNSFNVYSGSYELVDFKSYDEQNNLYLIQEHASSGGFYLRLIEIENDNINVLDTIHLSAYKMAYCVHNGKIIVGVKIYPDDVVIVYSIENYNFVEKLRSSDRPFEIMSILKTDDNNIAVFGFDFTNSKWCIQRMNITDSSFGFGTIYKVSYSASNKPSVWDFDYLGNGYFGGFYYRGGLYFKTFTFDGTNFYDSYDSNLNSYSDVYDNKDFFAHQMKVRNGLILKYIKPSSSTNGYVKCFTLSNSGGISEIKKVYTTWDGYKNHGYDILDDNWFIVNGVSRNGSTNKTVIFYWDKQNLIINEQSDSNVINSEYCIYIKTSNKTIGFHTYQGASGKVYTLDNFNIYDGELSNLVESYSGGFTVGFAKNAGVAGDVIQVYVPYSS